MFPVYLAKLINFLRKPRLRWLRLSVGILLIIGGCFWFLPILELEMIPIGLMLLAIDVPFLRGPVSRMIAWGERGLSAMFSLLEVLRARLRLTANATSNFGPEVRWLEDWRSLMGRRESWDR